MGTVAVQTQCCLQQRDESDDEASQEEKVQLLEPVRWCSGSSPLGANSRPPTTVPRSLSETTRIP